jgi:hypothetical protein
MAPSSASKLGLQTERISAGERIARILLRHK